jgi:hypothetical protein
MDLLKWDAGFTYHGLGVMYVYNGFLFSNQPDALFNQIYSVIKIYTFRASSLPIIRSSLLYKQGQDGTEFHPDPAWIGHHKPA